jgi:hypothetical protein
VPLALEHTVEILEEAIGPLERERDLGDEDRVDHA